jgi:prepilin-type N-terminal cleavage/methylation domain-containing protein
MGRGVAPASSNAVQPPTRGARGPRACVVQRLTRQPRLPSEGGFTLIELLVTMTIMPIIAGAIALALLSTFQLQPTVSDRLGSTGDAQVVTSSFFQDVQSATQLTTSATPTGPAQCGSNGQILGLEWSTPGSVFTIVSYDVDPNGIVSYNGSNEANLVRLECTYATGSVPTLVSTQILSYNVPSGLTAAIVGQSCSTTCAVEPAAASAGWTASAGTQSVSLTVNEAAASATSYSSDPKCSLGATYCYVVSAAPRSWVPTSGGNPVSLPSSLTQTELIGAGSNDLTSCSGTTSKINVNGQLVIDSATSPSASGGKNVNPTSVYYYSPGGAPTDLAGSPSKTALTTAMPDPLQNLAAPNMTGLPTDPSSRVIGGVTYYYPGIYDASDPITGPATLTTGFYELEAGINGTGNITSGPGGDLLYVTGGSVTLTGLNITPLTSGPYANLSLWQGPAVASGQPYDTNNLTMSGTASAQVVGILYAPGANVTWTPSNSSPETVQYLIAKGLTCSGSGSGVADIGGYPS